MAGFAHFALGTLLPLTYKSALVEGASVEQAARMCMRWASYMTLPDVLMILLLYLPLLMILYMTARGKYGIPRKALLINAGYIVLIVVLQVILKTGNGSEYLAQAKACLKAVSISMWSSTGIKKSTVGIHVLQEHKRATLRWIYHGVER